MLSLSQPLHADHTNLRAAYLELTEEQKRRFSQAIAKRDPKLFHAWFSWASCNGFTEKGAASRPAGVGLKLDLALTKTEGHEKRLRSTVSCFFVTEFGQWVEFVTDELDSKSGVSIEAQLKRILGRADAPFAKSEWYALFSARALLTPNVWLEAIKDRTSDKGSSPAYDVRKHFEEKAGLLHGYVSAIEEALVAAAAARPFSVQKVQADFAALNEVGEELRDILRVAKGGQLADSENGDWDTFEALEKKIEALLNDSALDADIKIRRERILSVASALNEIVRLNMKAALMRARAEEHKKSAIAELEAASVLENPPRLPGCASGRQWIQDVLQLEPEAFEGTLSELSKALLNSLGSFLSEVNSWERIAFEPDSVLAPTVKPEAGTTEPLPSISAAVEETKETFPVIAPPGFVPPSAEGAAPTPSPVPVAPLPPAPVADAPIVVVSVVPPVTAAPVVPVKVNGGSEVVAPSTSSDENTALGSGKSQQDPAEKQSIEKRCELAERDSLAMQRYAERDQWAVCGSYRDQIQAPPLPPVEVFEILALLPAVGQQPGAVVDGIRARLAAIEAPTDAITLDELLLWNAALIPSCVLVPFSNASAFLRTLHLPEKLAQLHEIGQAAIRLAESVPHCSVQLLRGSQPRQTWETQLRELTNEVEGFEREAKAQTILYQPATEVWKYLWKNGVFAELVRNLRVSNGGGDRRRVIELLEQIQPGKNFHRLIQSIHQKQSPGSKVHIEARALPQFENKSRPLRDIAQRWVDLTASVPQASNFVNERIGEFKGQWMHLSGRISRAVAEDKSVGAIAKSALSFSLSSVDTILSEEPLHVGPEADPEDVIARELLAIAGLRFDLNRRPVKDPSIQLEALRNSSTTDASLYAATATRILQKDILGAKYALALFDTAGDKAAAELRASWEIVMARTRNELEARLRGVRRQASNARLSGIIGESDAATLEAGFVILEKGIREDDDLQSVENDIEKRSATLADQTLRGKTVLLDRVRASVPPGKDRERLEKLIATEDVMTVHEYLSRLAANEKLPKEDGKNLQPFAGFTLERQDELNAALNSSGDLDALRTAIRSGGAFAHTSYRGWVSEARLRDSVWIETWLKVKGSGLAEQERVEVLLSSLGFVVQSVKTSNRGAVQISESYVEPLTERSVCPIPKFGSLAVGSITIRHVWKWVDEEAILQSVGETAQQSQLQLLFFYGRLAPDRRLALSKLCRAKRRSFLVLDELLLAHLCSLTEGRLGAFFRATTPFTFADPFVTASSLVPPEMFYGREEELAALMSSDNGRCFVYGGRQLGKTALLREAERRFSKASPKNFAAWIDLLDHGIGRAHAPKEIWKVLDKEFGSWPGYERQGLTEDEVPGLIEAWLNKDTERRILLLLDEADRFLEEDAREDFREARRLKGIMDRTSRRFKVVFAGLHNVQRTTRQANHPLAHLGEPINVGALSQNREWHAAFALASEPLTALGVRFSSADLVSRVLTICNFYPGLIQQFCSRMLRRLLERRVEGPPFPITETELDEVYRDPNLRQDIVGRFKLTLQLDPRYWHLAHVVALRFLEAPQEAEVGYSANDLVKLASEWWQDGFAQNTPDEFRSLLDEMCALGVLRLVGDRYSFRNSNILLLLGTRGEVESQLLAGPRQIIDYTPRSFRARRKKGESFLRRPLTMSEESRLSQRENAVSFVIGSSALGLDDVGGSLAEVASGEHYHPLRGNITSLSLFERELTNLAASTRTSIDGFVWIWVPAALRWDNEWVEVASNYCDRLRSDRRYIRVIFETTPDQIWATPQLWARRRNEEHTKLWMLRKWTPDFMGPWLMELGVPTATGDIEKVMEATGGWPALAYELARRSVHVGDWRKAVDGLRDPASFLKEVNQASFVGNSTRALQGFEMLKKLREQQLPGDKVLDSDLPAYAELLDVEEQALRETLDTAEMLGLIDRTEFSGRSWDSIFDRAMLA